ncbi:Cas10/Cmr2 second palm domain-containing protein [Clostridium oryzae]|uniref:CRISPR-associated protein n=1 Tax=Clostridium oryzae TaxID=1450648 RepID=A0A1V4ISA0_9CLOT|nr:type III-B CRISPR-associated protein Cas10/Cmr2 [Clostridium oryzae]OPJ62769.1 CRISPR-associated protein [Clostridium oryzae]
MSCLIGVTVGPIQAYIKESRKLSDLYVSSKIMSDIMKNIIKFIKEKDAEARLIYPNYDVLDIDATGDCSNYMVFEAENVIDMKNIEESVYNKLAQGNEKLVKQFKDDFYLFWGIKDFAVDNYHSTYLKLERLMRSLKNTYMFTQSCQEGGKKCSICGKRNIVRLTDDIKRKKGVAEDENLCPTCLFKREYLDKKLNQKFSSSIYSISINVWKKNNEKFLQEINSELLDVFKQVNKVSFEEVDRYYDVNQLSNLIKKFKGKDEKIESKLILIKKELEKVYNEKNDIKIPDYEYCLMQLDVDDLGKWIRGEFLKNKDTDELKNFQKKLSAFLIEFGLELRSFFEKSECQVVYSGGDDSLIILPTEEIMYALDNIDKIFEELVWNKMKKYFDITRKISYSISATIAKCNNPLGYSIQRSREELERVKTRFNREADNKNGVSFNYIINDGKEIVCYLRRNTVKLFYSLVKEYENIEEDGSFSYINWYETEFSKFNYTDISFENLLSLKTIMKCEMKRLLGRSIKGRNSEENRVHYINGMIELLNKLYLENYTENRSNHITIDFLNILNTFKLYEKLCSLNFHFEKGV